MASLQLGRSIPRSSPALPRSRVHIATCVLSKTSPMRSDFGRDFLRDRIGSVTVPLVVKEDDTVMIVSKLHAIVEAAEDRAEVHAIIGEQRNNWNELLLNSINSITLAASISTGLAGMAVDGSGIAFRISSTVLYMAATALLSVVNYIQPSQLAEEQRQATRLYKQVINSVKSILAAGKPTQGDVDSALKMVLSIDSAYPLALLNEMIEKFPEKVEPAVWWPGKRHCRSTVDERNGRNGWDKGRKREQVMEGLLKEIREKHTPEYLQLGDMALRVNKILAITGPVITGIAALASACNMEGGTVVGVVGGALATFLNSLQHGGQVGMVFEMYRNCAGFYREIEEDIERNLEESDVERRENGELFEFRVSLKLSQEPSSTYMD